MIRVRRLVTLLVRLVASVLITISIIGLAFEGCSRMCFDDLSVCFVVAMVVPILGLTLVSVPPILGMPTAIRGSCATIEVNLPRSCFDDRIRVVMRRVASILLLAAVKPSTTMRLDRLLLRANLPVPTDLSMQWLLIPARLIWTLRVVTVPKKFRPSTMAVMIALERSVLLLPSVSVRTVRTRLLLIMALLVLMVR